MKILHAPINHAARSPIPVSDDYTWQMLKNKTQNQQTSTFAAKAPSSTNPMQVNFIVRLRTIIVSHRKIKIDNQIDLQTEMIRYHCKRLRKKKCSRKHV